MTVKELKKQLDRFDDDCEVIWEGDFSTGGYNKYDTEIHTVDELAEMETKKNNNSDIIIRHDGSSYESNWPKEDFLQYIGEYHKDNLVNDYEKFKERAKRTVVIL